MGERVLVVATTQAAHSKILCPGLVAHVSTLDSAQHTFWPRHIALMNNRRVSSNEKDPNARRIALPVQQPSN